MDRLHCLTFCLLLTLSACDPALDPGPGDDDDSAPAIDDDDSNAGDDDSKAGDDDSNAGDDCRTWHEDLNQAHELCREAMGDMYYCGPDGVCLEASGCEALDCCLPGEQGDRWCRDNFGEDSSCIAGPNDGYCGRGD